MWKSKLIDLLRQVNEQELAHFRDYVYSPMVNKREKIRRLLDFLLEFAPQFEHSDCNKANAGLAIFGKKPFSNTSLNNIISDTLQLLYDFLAFQEYQSNTYLQQELLTRNLIQRNSLIHAEKAMRKMQKQLNDQSHRDASHFQEQFVYFENVISFFYGKFDAAMM